MMRRWAKEPMPICRRVPTENQAGDFSLEETLKFLETRISKGPLSLSSPSIIKSISDILHSCRKVKNSSYIIRIYQCMQETGLDSHQLLGNQLVPLLVDAGKVHNAQKVLDKLPSRSECAWTSIINGYIKHGDPQRALLMYGKMLKDAVQPTGYTYVSLLKACLKLKDVERGRHLHDDICRQGLEKDLFVGSALVDMFAKFDLLEKAQEVFDNLSVKDAMSWNAIISGYVRHGRCKEALDYYDLMQSEGITPNIVTFVCMLKACGNMENSQEGRELHAEVSRRGFDRDLTLGNTLIDMYGNCGLPMKAKDVFDKLPVRDVISWTSLISGYVKGGFGIEALHSFEQMKSHGFSPDVVTFVCSLKACGMTKSLDLGKDIHSDIMRDSKLLDKNPLVGNALVDMYAKCGVLEKAQEVFNKLSVRDATTWNSLIAGYCKQGLSEEALVCFDQMSNAGVPPDAVTLSCILKACGNLGVAEKARQVNEQVSNECLMKRDLVVCNGLIDMYAKCGLLVEAQRAFDVLPVQDLVSWNSLISGYAQVGESDYVFSTFRKMLNNKEMPNEATFGSILNACIHAGLVSKGQAYFHSMLEDFKISPSVELHTCIINLLGRAGQLDKAIAFTKRMPAHPTLVVWNTVLGACRKWSSIEFGRQAFEHAIGIEERDAAAYVCMYNLYADAHMLEQAKSIEVMGYMNQALDPSSKVCWSEVG
ncbi:hypothetical protein KP509_39G009800 [Ceratopteris richardii]|uniref:Pentatricopeptide repeat-containing protein n=1 Tax=Ceratopteris richardii TaxID=49495 RepID=A0A8T2PYA7_CERRI|nr:hypothetical protein KP509_39G009800 [Ceratopteris richardii]KAH7276504.1 hypothetical protein KP509_39G009800 [Ceratopteris richardii]